ncbi:amidohydrolase [Auritidibacter sp. NML130574]|uniref:amidohydrolase family protein n=1 Tax=Auritidibacter sp. NML130574 TaxID=2170745 RepID=UPI000D72A041|nr:amidohydrolase family protein [Auritidibacter sp. NML130574]AXR74679.1 amidohydrolase [Auritidibacter sp. NML130574]
MKVIDAHFHQWDPNVQSVPWLSDRLNRTYRFEDLRAEYDKYDDVEFLGGVYVEIDQDDPEQEDQLVYERQRPQILGRVLRSQLSPWMRVPVHATGIREPLHTAPSGRVMEQSFIEGLRSLPLPFDVTCRGEDITDIARALAQVPEAQLVLDHLGNVTDLTPESRAALRDLAQLPSCYVKISGDDPVQKDVVDYVAETFGKFKVLYASNFPVRADFDEHFCFVRSVFKDDEDVFAFNALRAYQIGQER